MTVLLAKSDCSFGQKPAPLDLIRPYGPYYTIILGQRPIRALLYYYTALRALLERKRRLKGIHGNTGIREYTEYTGYTGTGVIREYTEYTEYTGIHGQKPALLALAGQKVPNQVVLDSPDLVRSRIRRRRSRIR